MKGVDDQVATYNTFGSIAQCSSEEREPRMEYHVSASEPVQSSVRRIARGKIDRAIEHIADEEMGRHETVHEVRKRCKEIRAVLRLVRPELGETYSTENAWFRDAARELSDARDAQALVETFDERIGSRLESEIDVSSAESVRETLVDRRRRVTNDEMDLDGRLETVDGDLRAARERVGSWTVESDGFDAVAGGVAKSYRRGREAMAAAYDDPSTERFHEWRKRVKYHRYHTRLLREIWRGPMKARRAELKTLSDLLGDEHDLAVFGAVVANEPDLFDDRVREAITDLIEERRADLQDRAEPLGRRVYVEDPDQLVARLEGYWRAWVVDEDGPGSIGSAETATRGGES